MNGFRSRAGTPKVICLPEGPVGAWRRRPSKRALVALGGAFLTLAGCTTFATNVRGSFACGAPGDGTCAPATVIDDRALAQITGDAGYVPAGPYRPAPADMGPGIIAASAPAAGPGVAQAAPVPVGQKVLRIVFPAHVDRSGRYHETSIVRAVVDNGSWMRASADHGVPLAQTVNLTVNPDILSQLDAGLSARQQEPGAAVPEEVAVLDPNLPTVDAVAAARARGAARVANNGNTVNRPAAYNPQVEN
ncbi:conjugal transfer protein [Croceicoccus marinus]|uniref:Conjugal transfer protein n=1 Tax=Croceicoccus marinus TaxID=450378 RepID=A0A7G6W1B0_9SPHN|nr:conjugal transfer protein [Croceicoccus marinus]QNE07775.1 conjugal transfer protein [Croceicoccus marinus]